MEEGRKRKRGFQRKEKLGTKNSCLTQFARDRYNIGTTDASSVNLKQKQSDNIM